MSTTEASPADRVLQLLATLARAEHPLTASELSARTGISRSSLYRLLTRLKHHGFASELDRRYSPGPLGLQLARGFDDGSQLTQAARPLLGQLVEQTRESAGLMIAVNGEAICLDMVESPRSLRCSFVKGSSVPLQGALGASAKCVLAHLPAAQRDALLAAHYGAGSTRYRAAAQELQAHRDRGYVTSLGEVDAGVWGCSAPIFAGARAVAALTLMAPEQRLHDQEPALIEATLIAAARIGHALSHPTDTGADDPDNF